MPDRDDEPTRPVTRPEVRTTVTRREERLEPHVELVQAGDVVIRKRVVEEPQTVAVRLAHDELDLTRTTVDRPLQAGEQAVTERGEETVVLVVEERLEVRRVPYVVEEIRVRRRVVHDEREITDTVRKERIEIEPEGEVQLLHSRDVEPPAEAPDKGNQ